MNADYSELKRVRILKESLEMILGLENIVKNTDTFTVLSCKDTL